MRIVLAVCLIIGAAMSLRFVIIKLQAHLLIAETEYVLNEQYSK